MEEKKNYYVRLDIIRIISCILVLLYHLNVTKGGYLAVCTFFVLSGYLVCMSALKKEEFSIKAYFLNRLKKIYLPLIVVVFITVIILKFFTTVIWVNLKPETLSVILGYNNFWQLNANLDYFTRNVNSPFTHLWYISILMQFDLVFPIIFVLLRKMDKKFKNIISSSIVLLVMIITTGIFCYMSKTQDMMSVYYSTIARSFSIIFGIYIAIIHNEYKINFPSFFKKNNALIFTGYCVLLIALCIFVPNQSNDYALFMILTTFITTRLIKYSIINEKRTAKESKLFSGLASITYEIYLVQYPVIFFMRSFSMNEIIKDIVIISITILTAIIIHYLCFKFKNKIFRFLRAILIIAIIIIGSVIVIIEKDNTEEMKELENMLSENTKIMEEKNKEFIDPKNSENKADINNTNSSIVNMFDNNSTINNNTNKSIVNTTTNNQNNNTTLNEHKKKVDEKEIEEKVSNLKVVGIGDSVLLDAINEFYKKFPKGYFDGKISRTLYKAKDVVKDLKNKGKLGNTLILCLATNGDYSNKINKDFMELVGERDIYWINAVGADDPKFNEKFKKFAEDYSNIHIIDWEVEAKKHPEYFYSDGVHMKAGKGMKAYVDYIYQAIYNDYLQKAKNENK